jgi:hypothetical protein
VDVMMIGVVAEVVVAVGEVEILVADSAVDRAVAGLVVIGRLRLAGVQ